MLKIKDYSKREEKGKQSFRKSMLSKTNDTKLDKVKSLSDTKARKKSEDSLALKKFEHGIKRSEKEIKKSSKSLRLYIKQKCKWVTFMFVIYIIILGAVISMPFIHNHFRVMSQNGTEQERSITRKIPKGLVKSMKLIIEHSCKDHLYINKILESV